jgi:hypothetical protein
MRLKHTVLVQIGEDTAFKKKLFFIEDTAAPVQTDGYLRQSNSIFNVGVSSSETMKLGDVAAVKGLYLECDQEVLVRINGSLDSIQLRKATDATVAKLFLECDITELVVENTDPTNEANGLYCVWGDVSP